MTDPTTRMPAPPPPVDPSYTYQPYPAWRYHPDGRSCIVQTPADDDALGEGWADSPTAFETAPVAVPGVEPTPSRMAEPPSEAAPDPTAPVPRRPITTERPRKP
jgi:hypothetical protein